MTRQRFVVLLVVALLVVAGAIWLSHQRSLRRDDTAGARVLPALASGLNEVSEVRLVKAGEQVAVTLRRDKSDWVVGERANHPADNSKVRKLLIDLSDLKVVEQKTDNPANYAVLGVEDVKAPDATGVRLELAGVPEPTALIVGKSAGSRSSYARLAQSAQSLAVSPSITLDTDPRHWLDCSVLDIAAPRVQQVRVTEPTGRSYAARRESREQTDFTVPELPKGRVLTSPTAANAGSTALGAFTCDDVRPAVPAPAAAKDVVRAEFRLFDGTVIAVTGRKEGERHWIHLAPSYDEAQQQLFSLPAAEPAAAAPDGKAEPAAAPAPAATERKPDEVQAEVKQWAARFAGWDYEVPAYKYESLFRPLDELIKKP
jgi:hypothetical protein